MLDARPLTTLLPASLSLLEKREAWSQESIVELFEEGLQESKCCRSAFSDLKFYHSDIPGQKELALAIQEQWDAAFGIKVQTVEETWNRLSHQLDNRLVHFGLCYRHPYYYDAMYFFQMFYDAGNIHNAFGWQCETFNHQIDLALAHPENSAYLKLAEEELMEQMPVIPIHMVSYHYLTRNELRGIYFPHSGDVDLKWIYFSEKT